jgi:hypothetical protein
MAMNKKEQQLLEDLKTKFALRWTEPVAPDIEPPDSLGKNNLRKGFLFNAYSGRVEPACTDSLYHSFGCDDEARSQGSQRLYSTRFRALKAMRHEVEKECAKKLREIDRKIEAESL